MRSKTILRGPSDQVENKNKLFTRDVDGVTGSIALVSFCMIGIGWVVGMLGLHVTCYTASSEIVVARDRLDVSNVRWRMR
jgi:hypothetical protein